MTQPDLWHLHVVDDDAAFRRSLLFLLESMGWDVTGHASGPEFLAACPEPDERIGCLLLDIRMPQMSGLELQRTLGERDWTTPVVFIIGHGDVELAVQAMKQGAFDFLEKPFKDQRLLDVVSAALRQHEAEVALLVARGLPNKLVARELDISEKTVHIHRQHVMEKLGIGSAAELARVVLRADPGALD
jgi:two-component system response regulator FixJ